MNGILNLNLTSMLRANQAFSEDQKWLEPVLVLIPQGWFSIGCATGQDNEKPVHRVWIDAFYLAAYQVTNLEYDLFLADTHNPPPPLGRDTNFNHAQQPVVSVSWFDSARYAQWLAAKTGRRYRLPTEAEWERAARGGLENKLFPWGDEPPQSRPDYTARWQHGPERIGHSPPNHFGLYDICENVHEWASDWYSADYYHFSPERNPKGPESGSRKASRGGSWRHHIKIARCAARSSIPPEFHYADYGFRLACDL